MKSWIRIPAFVVAVLALSLVVLPLQAAPAQAPEGTPWSFELPQVLISWVQGVFGPSTVEEPPPVDLGTPDTNGCEACSDGSGDDGGGGGEIIVIIDPNG